MAVRLHIKICEARKVLKMDLGGKSDPYITLKLKSQEKKKELIKRTQVISNTTDPIWNQEFDIVAELSDTLLIDMFDEDIKKDDKMMDQLSYPVNKWKVGGGVDHLEVDLKLKKKKAGTLVFEVEAFEAEGSAPPPEPVQERAANLAVPCKLRIRAVDGKGLKKMDVGGKSDPYLTFQLKSDKKSKQKSQVISNSCDPVWNQDFVFNVADWNSEVLLVNMWDEDIAKDDKMMNELEFPLASWPIGSHNVFDDNIKLKKKSAGHLHLEFNVLNVDDAVPANEAPPAAQAAAGSVQVRIKIYDAKGLKKMDVGGKSDPYMTFHLKGTDRKKDGVKSQVISNNCDPVWNQELFLNVADINKAELLVNMFDEDIAKDDKMMNEISYTLKDVPFNTVQVFDEDIKLKKKSAGHLHFEFELLGEEPVKTRDVVIEENLEYCNFSLGSYSSSYSTDFSSYNTCSHPLSSIHSSERKLHKHHFHASKPKAPKPKRVGESIKGVIVSCNGLPKADSDGTDAYVTITVISKAEKEKKSAEKVKTEIVHDTSDPVYNKEFNFEHAKKGDSLKVEVRQSHKLLGDQVIGQCIVPLKNVKENEAIQESYPLAKPDKCPKFLALIVNFGTITLSLTHSVQYK